MTGCAWREPAGPISAAGARAVAGAFEAFQALMEPGARVFVPADDTTANSGPRKGFSRAHRIGSDLTHSRPAWPSRAPQHQTKRRLATWGGDSQAI